MKRNMTMKRDMKAKSGALVLSMVLLSALTHAASPQAISGKVVRIFTGYQEGGVFFTVDTSEVKNPAGCSKSSGYFITPTEGNPEGAMALLLTAKTTDRAVWGSVMSNKCHTVVQQDFTETYPIVQRLGFLN